MKINPPARFSLAQIPTPIEVLPLSPAPESGIEIFIKRDDLTGSILSGNKIRKLEFLFYDLVSKKSDIVITCGAVQSNHCRAVAALCAMSNIECHLVLKGKEPKIPDGNYFFDRLFGAKATFVSVREYEKDINGIMERIAGRYRKNKKKPYVIPEGGTDPLGIWGYVKALEEIKRQCRKSKIRIDTICCAVGSGGTYAGLYLGNKIARWNVNIFGVSVFRNKPHCQKVIYDNCIAFEKTIGKKLFIDPKEFEIDDNHIGPSYGKIGPEETDFIRNVAANSGIVLDPAYTSKALLGLFRNIADGKFQRGSKILFIHTGGQWGLLPSRRKFSER
jgi:D-cysteine desulfhydrase